jgi:zinc/manganese transport system permease protein
MADLIAFLGLPFLACVLMGTMLGYLGIHVLKREVIFIDIAVAQVAAMGAIGAHIVWHVEEDSLASLAFSLGCVWLMAVFYAVARKKITQISIEAVIGISYAITTAGALFLIGLHPGHLHVTDMLAGSLLWLAPNTLIETFVVFLIVGLMLALFRRPLTTVSEDYSAASNKGLKVVWYDFVFYVLLGTVITLSVRMSGVLCVFAFLIIPATASALLSQSWLSRVLFAWIMMIVASIAGLLFAYYLDFSVGPPIALFLGLLLLVVTIIKKALLGKESII